MRPGQLILLVMLLLGCAQDPKPIPAAHELSRPVVRIIEASSPLYLDSIRSAGGSAPSEKLEQALQGLVKEFYFHQCVGDSEETFARMADALLFTLRISGRTGDYYFMFLQEVPQGFVIGRLVKWDPRRNIMIGGPVDIPLSGMYQVRNGKLTRSNLQHVLKLTGPQLEVLDTLGQEAVAVRRLWHNGTFNALDRTVICLDQGRIDTLATEFVTLHGELAPL